MKGRDLPDGLIKVLSRSGQRLIGAGLLIPDKDLSLVFFISFLALIILQLIASSITMLTISCKYLHRKESFGLSGHRHCPTSSDGRIWTVLNDLW